MTRLNKLTALAAAVALSGGLAACGGGGGSTDTAMMPDPEPTPQEMCEMANGRYESDGSCTSATELQVEGLQTQIAALRTQLGLGPSDDIGASITELQDTLKALQKQVDDAADKAEMDAKKAAAADAEALFTGLDTDREPAGADLAVTSIVVSDTYGGGGSAEVTASVAVDGGTATMPEVEATDTAVPSLGMWKGTELFVDTDGAMPSNTVVVYTDVEDNTSMAFDAVYADETNANGDLTLGVAQAGTSEADYVPLISAPAFMHAGEMDHAPDAGTGDDAVVVRLSGTFHGAAGQYTCTATDEGQCVSNEDDNGVRLTGAGGWEFTPAPGAMVSVADSTYLHFGWWLHKSSDGPEVVVFHGVTEPAASAEEIAALSGTATYSGAAAGKYAIDPVAPGTYASGGHWTADASLTADFGTETTEGTITGTIDGFMTDNGAEDWSVSLGETGLAAVGTFSSEGDGATTAGDDVVWTIADEAAPEAGSWSGALHGQTPPPDGNNVPSGVTGQFSSVYSEGGHNIGHMVGAFGAHVDE
jgi:hypothetical protein